MFSHMLEWAIVSASSCVGVPFLNWFVDVIFHFIFSCLCFGCLSEKTVDIIWLVWGVGSGELQRKGRIGGGLPGKLMKAGDIGAWLPCVCVCERGGSVSSKG